MAKKKEQKQEQTQEQEKENLQLKKAEKSTPLDSELETKGDIEEYRTMVLAKINDGLQYYEDNLHASWEKLASLYEGIRARTEKMLDWQNNLSPNTAFGVIQQQFALFMNALMPKKDNYNLKPRKYVEDKKKVEKTILAHKEVMDIQSKMMHEYRNFSWLVLDALIYSSGKMSLGWFVDYKENRYYLNTKTGKKEKVDFQKISRPFIRVDNPFDVVIDPDCDAIHDDINGANYIAVRTAINAGDLRNSPRYNVKEEVDRFFVDNEKIKDWDKLECWEFKTPTEFAVVVTGINSEPIPTEAGGGYLVEKHYTTLKCNKIPMLTFVAYTKQRSAEGLSTMLMIRDSVEYMAKIINSNADALDLAVLGLWMMKSDSDIPFNRAEVYPSRVFKVGTMDELQKLETGGVSPDSYRELELHKQLLEGVTGNLDAVNVQPESKTATEAKIEASRQTIKTKHNVKFNAEEFVLEYLRFRIDMNQQFLTAKDVIMMIGERRAKELELEESDIDFNVDLDIELSGELAEIDRVNEADKINSFVTLVAGVMQLPDAVDKMAILKEMMSMFGYPDKWIVNIEQKAKEQIDAQKNASPNAPATSPAPADKASVVSGIEQEIQQMAQEAGQDPETLINGIATKLKVAPEQLMQQAVDAGGFNKLIQTIQQGG